MKACLAHCKGQKSNKFSKCKQDYECLVIQGLDIMNLSQVYVEMVKQRLLNWWFKIFHVK